MPESPDRDLILLNPNILERPSTMNETVFIALKQEYRTLYFKEYSNGAESDGKRMREILALLGRRESLHDFILPHPC